MSVQRALRELVGFRSGDKANLVNIALFADDEILFEGLCVAVTPEAVALHLAIGAEVVRCYRADNVRALNIVIHDALGGGGPATLFGDNLGKSFASRLLDMEIAVPDAYATATRPRADVSWAKEILARVPQS